MITIMVIFGQFLHKSNDKLYQNNYCNIHSKIIFLTKKSHDKTIIKHIERKFIKLVYLTLLFCGLRKKPNTTTFMNG